MKQFFVLGIAVLALCVSGCATRGYARKQAAVVNERVNQIQTQTTALSAKHETDVTHVNDRVTATDNKLQEAATNALLFVGLLGCPPAECASSGRVLRRGARSAGLGLPPNIPSL